MFMINQVNETVSSEPLVVSYLHEILYITCQYEKWPSRLWSYGSWIYKLPTCMQSVPVTTDVVSSNLDQGEVYNIMR